MVPGVLLGLPSNAGPAATSASAAAGATEQPPSTDGKQAEAAPAPEAVEPQEAALAAAALGTTGVPAALPAPAGGDQAKPDISSAEGGKEEAAGMDGASASQPTDPAAVGAGGDGDAAGGGGVGGQILIILGKLPHCVSRDMCDEISVNFCFNNSKVRGREGGRRYLAAAFCNLWLTLIRGCFLMSSSLSHMPPSFAS